MYKERGGGGRCSLFIRERHLLPKHDSLSCVQPASGTFGNRADSLGAFEQHEAKSEDYHFVDFMLVPTAII